MAEENIETEQEIVLREKRQCIKRLYVKPAGQSGVVVTTLGEEKTCNWFRKIFLPRGYPASVSEDYMSYQIWDTSQAFCSTIAGILATQEVLRGVGVGDATATSLAATITWVLKDGCGHVGRILFAFSHGKYLDAYSKKWRIYADVLNDMAMLIEINLQYYGGYSMVPLCISTIMKAVVGVAGGATRMALTQHHALQGNLADVSAKDAAQETAVNLVASMVSILILNYLGSSVIIFLLMIILHVGFNYMAVRAVCLRTLNDSRYMLLLEQYLRDEQIASPKDINKEEPLAFSKLGTCKLDVKKCNYQIKVGTSVRESFECALVRSELALLREVYARRPYLLVMDRRPRVVHVLLKDGAGADDALCGYFHAVLLAIASCAINSDPVSICEECDLTPFSIMFDLLRAEEWAKVAIPMPNKEFTYILSKEFLEYLNWVVETDWPELRADFSQEGWNMSKHVLIVDDWRISKDVDPSPASAGEPRAGPASAPDPAPAPASASAPAPAADGLPRVVMRDYSIVEEFLARAKKPEPIPVPDGFEIPPNFHEEMMAQIDRKAALLMERFRREGHRYV